MGKIQVLPDTLCNQIAAGEVVERPSAVIKELVENSLDAASRKISLSLQQGGRKEIRVVDNGTGMSPDDALLALERHATSKIASIEDLQAIRSLGFRGEALPSIAAVSRFELITREPDAVSGTLIQIEGGVLRDFRETGCPVGTMITVRDLFHNIPARRKFLRSVDTEMAHISDQFLRLSMAHPQVHFQLSHQGRLVYDFPQAKMDAGRVGQILGTDLSSKLRPFSAETSSMRLSGFAGAPDTQRANSQSIFVYVNGRAVWDRTLNRAILSAYETLMPKGRFPVAILFVEMDADLVDVNVHPTKREVRFRSPGETMETVRNTLQNTLESMRPRCGSTDLWKHPPSFGSSAFAKGKGQFSRENQTLLSGISGMKPPEEAPRIPIQVRAFDGVSASVPQPDFEEDRAAVPSEYNASQGGPAFSRLPVLGQLANAYILLEAPDGLIVIDQHAAHERILFDQLSASPSPGAGQRLVRSVVLELLPKEAMFLRRWVSHLEAIGFEIEPFGGDSFVVSAVPAVLSAHPVEALIRGVLEGVDAYEDSPRLDLLQRLAKTASCHGAVKAGQKLRSEEIRRLLESLDDTRFSSTCPHGRPLWFTLTHQEIARLFHRT